VAAAAGGGWWWLSQRPVPTPAPTPAASVAPAPTPTATPTPEATPTSAASVTPPPPVAPPPTFAEAQGKGAAAVRAAQAAFKGGEYARAVTEAQAALREDPGNLGAQKILDQALAGQKALGLVAQAEAALAAADFDKAQALADQARAAAPWDSGVSGLYGRIDAARSRAAQQAQQQGQARVAQLLNEAEAAVGAQKWDEALRAYDEALKLDPQNVVARSGRTSVLAARTSGPARSPGGHTFVAEKTVATPAKASAGNLPPGFDAPDAGVKVQKGTQASDLPGRVAFEVSPEAVKSGERFTVRVLFANEGQAAITLSGMQLATTINGRKTGGPVPPRALEVGPGQRAVVHELQDLWREDYTSWSLEVTLSTARGERYANRFSAR
jgi:tetratricopeptide (TPR) repeat protein